MRLLQKYTLGLLFFAVLFMTACNEDDTVVVDPTMTATYENFTDGDILQIGDTLEFTLEALAGTEDLANLVFFEDGSRLDNWEDRLFINEEAANTNALPLSGNAVDGFTWEIDLIVDSVPGEHEVVVEIKDTEGNPASIMFTYSSSNIDTLMGVLFNQGGPEGTGGLDLDTGEGTGTVLPDDANAEIRDQGIDNTRPVTDNWIQRIAPFDDAEMASLPSEFDYASVATQSEIISAFESGTLFPDGGESDVVQEGDVFAVKDNDKYYLILITEVVVTNEAFNNDDHYVIDIKKTR